MCASDTWPGRLIDSLGPVLLTFVPAASLTLAGARGTRHGSIYCCARQLIDARCCDAERACDMVRAFLIRARSVRRARFFHLGCQVRSLLIWAKMHSAFEMTRERAARASHKNLRAVRGGDALLLVNLFSRFLDFRYVRDLKSKVPTPSGTFQAVIENALSAWLCILKRSNASIAFRVRKHQNKINCWFWLAAIKLKHLGKIKFSSHFNNYYNIISTLKNNEKRGWDLWFYNVAYGICGCCIYNLKQFLNYYSKFVCVRVCSINLMIIKTTV